MSHLNAELVRLERAEMHARVLFVKLLTAARYGAAPTYVALRQEWEQQHNKAGQIARDIAVLRGQEET